MTNVIAKIRDLIARGQTDIALNLIRNLLNGNRQLDEVIIQSARHHRIEQEVRRGTLNYQEAELTRNQINQALLHFCREIEEESNVEILLNEEIMYSYNKINEYPIGPLVQTMLINNRIIQSFADIFLAPDDRRMFLNEANRLRREADVNARIIEPQRLPDAIFTPAQNYWFSVFNEAGLQGPRMVAALLYTALAQKHDAFPKDVIETIYKLLEQLKNHR